MNEREKVLLKALVNRYILDGQPVGSRSLSKQTHLNLSAATIRNIMADLEERGCVWSPHISSGRLPTVLGYRFFVDALLTPEPLSAHAIERLRDFEETSKTFSVRDMLISFAQLISELTGFVTVLSTPLQQEMIIRHVEFFQLPASRILMILVMADGQVEQQILLSDQIYASEALSEPSNFINKHYAGRSLIKIKDKVTHEWDMPRNNVRQLMHVALLAAERIVSCRMQELVMSGDRNLFTFADFSLSLSYLNALFDLLEQRTLLFYLLNLPSDQKKVKAVIGCESGFDEFRSVVGCLFVIWCLRVSLGNIVGVIGPLRMSYQTVIPIIEWASHTLSSSLSRILYGSELHCSDS